MILNSKIKWLQLGFVLVVAITTFSCKSVGEEGVYHSLNGARQKGIGEIDEIVMVCSNQMWESPVKDSIQYYFESPYLLLPQPEASFKVKHFSLHDVRAMPLRKKFLTMMLIADLSEPSSPETKMAFEDLGEERIQKLLSQPKAHFAIGRNKWAENQLIIYYLANSREKLQEGIAESFPAIAAQVRQHDKPRIHKRVYYVGTNKSSIKMLKDTFGVSLKVPTPYVVSAIRSKDAMWIRKETPKISSSLIISSIPFHKKAQLSNDSLKTYVNRIGKKYIASHIDSSYFVINDQDLPIIQNTTSINGHFAEEIRGIWELENDYMGGPFIAYLLQNPKKKNELLVIIGFAYAPQKDKKPLMEDLEEIIRTLDTQ